MNEKQCTCCHCVKPLAAFHRNNRSRDGLTSFCKDCRNAKSRAQSKRPEARAARKEYNRRWAKANPDKLHATQLRIHYGVTEAEYARRLAEQGGVCAICSQPCATGGRLGVDHDHSTGKVRGLLCRACNLALGQFGDSAQRMDSAIAYLRRTA